MQIYYLLLYFFVYGFLGWGSEVAFATVKENRFVNRGFLNGPICPIYGVGVSAVIFFLEPYSEQMFLLYLASVILVTVIEGLTGYAMDKLFHHKWWDYSNMPLNIGGYVCLIFSLVWGVACVLIVKLIHPVIHRVLSWIPQMVGIVILVILCMVLFADLYVTASTVLKMNRRLESMEKIAAELRELSDKMGESIHENVMETTEKFGGVGDAAAEKWSDVTEKLQGLQDAAEEQKKRVQELRVKYSELAGAGNKVSARLMRAFPKMESRKHKDILIELKKALEERISKS